MCWSHIALDYTKHNIDIAWSLETVQCAVARVTQMRAASVCQCYDD